MSLNLSHRGPDAEGFFLEDGLGFMHRRLSIIDLSAEANQPMFFLENRYVLIFNGEIYNYLEIKKQILNQYPETARHLQTKSDSEVVLAAYAIWGIEAVQKFNGMFALAIYDRQSKELFLCRDRLGEKSLYYYWDGQDFVFASELKALQKLTSLPKRINDRAIVHYLHLGYIPAPLSIYQNIYKLEAGEYIKMSAEVFEKKSYWNLPSSPALSYLNDESEVLFEMKQLLQSSVRYRLIADVPVGVFLSGGIDSSLIAAMATEQSTSPIETFTIGFEEPKYNESKYAQSVANFLGTKHHQETVSIETAKKYIPDLLNIYDEPYTDSSAIPTLLLSQFARKQVKVVLGGDGGDELFYGYGSYLWANRMHSYYQNPLRSMVGLTLKQFSSVSFQKAGSIFQYRSQDALQSHIFSQEQFLFSASEISRYYKPYQGMPIGSNFDNQMEKQAYFDLKYYLPDDLLVKIDRATMRYALEARVPFLDHRLVEFAAKIAPSLKFKEGTLKYLLKKLLYTYIPQKYFDRPKKGFSIPLAQWLQKDLRYLVEEYLHPTILNQHQVLDTDYILKIKKAFLNGNLFYYNRIWALIVLFQFLERESL